MVMTVSNSMGGSAGRARLVCGAGGRSSRSRSRSRSAVPRGWPALTTATACRICFHLGPAGVVGVDQRHSQIPTLPGAGRELDRGREPGVTGAQDQDLVLLRCCRGHRSAASFVSVVPAVRTTTRRKLPPVRDMGPMWPVSHREKRTGARCVSTSPRAPRRAAFNHDRTGSARELREQQEPQVSGRAWCFHAAREHDRLYTTPTSGTAPSPLDRELHSKRTTPKSPIVITSTPERRHPRPAPESTPEGPLEPTT